MDKYKRNEINVMHGWKGKIISWRDIRCDICKKFIKRNSGKHKKKLCPKHSYLNKLKNNAEYLKRKKRNLNCLGGN